MSEHFHQGLKWDCDAVDKRLRAFESEHDTLHDYLQKMQVTNGSLTDEIDKLKVNRDLWKLRFESIDKSYTLFKINVDKLVQGIDAYLITRRGK